MITGSEPAYPTYETAEASVSIGITKKEFYALMAMQGLMNNKKLMGDLSPSQLAHDAVIYAEELIEALNYAEQ